MIKEKDFKLLIIDDELELLENMVQLAKMMGYGTVYAAGSVEAAMIYLPKADGILADVNMPDKDILNSKLGSVTVPVARVTAGSDRVVNLMLKKPFNKVQFKNVLDQMRMLSDISKAA